MGYTVPTVHNSLGVKYLLMSSLGVPGLIFNGSADCLVTLSLSLAIVIAIHALSFSAGRREGRQVRAPVRGPGPAPTGDRHGQTSAAAHGRDSSTVPAIQGHVQPQEQGEGK